MDWLAVRVLQVTAWVWLGGSVLFGVIVWFGVTAASGAGTAPRDSLLSSVGAGLLAIVQGVLVWALLLCVASIADYCIWRRDRTE